MVNYFKKWLLVFLGMVIFFPVGVSACNNDVNIYLFHSKDCSHCKEELKVLEDIYEKYSNLNIYEYEIHNKENKDLFFEVMDALGVLDVGVPFLVIGDSYYVGYSVEYSRLKIIKTIDYYTNYGYEDKVSSILGLEKGKVCDATDEQLSIDDFMESYGKYEIFGYDVDNMEMELVSLILGIFSELNVISVVLMVAVSFVLLKCKNNYREKYLLFLDFMMSFIFCDILMLCFKSDIFVLVGLLGLLVTFCLKREKWVVCCLIGVINSCSLFYFNNNYYMVFKNKLEICRFGWFENSIQWLIYFVGVCLCLWLVFIFVYYLINKFFVKKYQGC